MECIEEMYSVDLSENELRYLVACGMALLQNIPGKSLSTYTSFEKSDIINFSTKIRDIMEQYNLDMQNVPLSNHIEDVMNNPSEHGLLPNDRAFFYQKKTNTIVITNPKDPDFGTAFRPDLNDNYTDLLRKAYENSNQFR